MAAAEVDSKPSQYPARIGHQTFPACLVYRWNKGIGHNHVKTPQAERDRGNQSRRTTPNN